MLTRRDARIFTATASLCIAITLGLWRYIDWLAQGHPA